MCKRKPGVFVCSLITVLILSQVLLAACGGSQSPAPAPSAKPAAALPAPAPEPAPAPTPVASPAAVPKPAAPVKPIELRLADWNPPSSGIFQIHQKMADRIYQQSNSRLKITLYGAESLAKMNEVFRATQTGVCDIGYWVVGSLGSSTELSRIPSMPFMGLKSMLMGNYVAQKLYDTTPEIQKEWPGLKVMGFRSLPGNQGQFTKKQVTLPTDMKGFKVIASGAQWSQIISDSGAAPVTLNIGDWYLSLERGLVEGQFTHFAVSYIFKTLDLYKYYTMFNEFGASGATDCYMFNLDTWNSLPPDLQKIVQENIEWRTQEISTFDIGEVQRGIDYAKSKKGTFIYLTPEQQKTWEDLAKPIVQKWIDEQQAKGLPAQKVYDACRTIIKEYTGK